MCTNVMCLWIPKKTSYSVYYYAKTGYIYLCTTFCTQDNSRSYLHIQYKQQQYKKHDKHNNCKQATKTTQNNNNKTVVMVYKVKAIKQTNTFDLREN